MTPSENVLLVVGLCAAVFTLALAYRAVSAAKITLRLSSKGLEFKAEGSQK
jgi:hypothetical protein